MQSLTHTVAGAKCFIYYPEADRDSLVVEQWLRDIGDQPLAVDTETTGLNIFSPGQHARLVQLGTRTEAFVLRVDQYAETIRYALRGTRQLIMHNAPFDLLVLDEHLGMPVEILAPRTTDTRIFAHLLDPRDKGVGGVGLGLKELSQVYVDDDAPDSQRELVKLFRSLGFTKATGWAHVPLDHPTFIRYAGLDVILARRLHDELARIVDELELRGLSDFEHHLQGLLCQLQRRGIKLDVDYTTQLRDELLAEAEQYELVAARYGVESVNSPKQVSEALAAMGETLTERTKAGQLSVGKDVLMPLADIDRDWQRIEARQPNPLADAVLRAKRAGKWATSYAGAALELRDAADRVHPVINALQARTARMSVSSPPLQQLPSSDWRVRRCFVADPGQLIIASDYSQVEMRVLAALSGDPTMLAAIESGVDLHDFTAERVYGEAFTKQQRKVAKAIGFGKVYGGGIATIVKQTGADPAGVKKALAAYDATYPGIKRYARKLQRTAEYGKKEVVTPAGRHLPLDRDRLYSATNYVVQSTARDLLAQAIVDLFDEGLGDYLLLPVHDELVAQAPADEAADVVKAIGAVMDGTFGGVAIVSDPDVYGPSWGHGYGAPTDKENPA